MRVSGCTTTTVRPRSVRPQKCGDRRLPSAGRPAKLCDFMRKARVRRRNDPLRIGLLPHIFRPHGRIAVASAPTRSMKNVANLILRPSPGPKACPLAPLGYRAGGRFQRLAGKPHGKPPLSALTVQRRQSRRSNPRRIRYRRHALWADPFRRKNVAGRRYRERLLPEPSFASCRVSSAAWARSHSVNATIFGSLAFTFGHTIQ